MVLFQLGRIDGRTWAQFSCKTTANPDLWDTKGGRVIGKSMQALEVNRKLDKMRCEYQQALSGDYGPGTTSSLPTR